MNVLKKQITLSVETATRNCSLALFRGNEIVADWRGDNEFSASDGLLREIQALLRKAKIEFAEINLLTAAIGPGSFTGLRVGLAIVKGLAAAWKIPTIGISTLEAMASDQPLTNPVCPILPAGRDNFLAKVFNPQISDENYLQSGKIEEILFELPIKLNWIIVAAPDFEKAAFDFLARNKINHWRIIAPSPNLAVGVAQSAFSQKADAINFDWHIIYGRDALVRSKPIAA